MKKITIYDVAKQSGVSLATVSRVINGSEAVKEDTRQKVEEAIAVLGYRPNSIAQGLASQKTTTIGLIIPEASFTYTGQILNGVLDVAKIYNYNIIIHTITDGISTVEEIIDMVIKSRVDGVIIYSDKIEAEDMEALNKYNIPVVTIGNKNVSDKTCAVYVDIEKAIFELSSKYLVDGIKHKSMYSERNSINSTRYRIAAEAGLAYKLYIKDDYDIECAYLEAGATKVMAASTNKKAKKLAWVHCDLLKAMDNPEAFAEKTKAYYEKYDKVVCVSENVKNSFMKLIWKIFICNCVFISKF